MSSIMPILTTPSEIFSWAWTANADASASVAVAAIKADFLMISSRRPAVRGHAVNLRWVPPSLEGRPFDVLLWTPPAAPRQAGLTLARPPDHHRGHDARALDPDPRRLRRGDRSCDPGRAGALALRSHRASGPARDRGRRRTRDRRGDRHGGDAAAVRRHVAPFRHQARQLDQSAQERRRPARAQACAHDLHLERRAPAAHSWST